ncbi:MAG: uroporphyrinogen decarboxylase family protein [Candidatus Latescibacterota bacterium]
MTEMTSRQRVQAALEHRQPDRTPVFEYVLLEPLAGRLLGRPYGGDPVHWDALVAELGWEGAVERNAADRVALAVLLGHDLIYAWPVPPPPPRGAPAGEPPESVDAAAAGACAEAAPDSARAAVPDSRVAEAPPEDDPVARLRRRNEAAAGAPPPADEPLLIYPALQREMARRGVDLPILAPAYAHGVWTDTDLMQTMVLEPAVADEHFRLATRRSLHLVERYAQLGLEQAGVGGDFAGNRPIISPQAYRSFIVPQVRRVSRRLHEHGMRAVNASDGDLWPVIDDFLLGCEVDGYLEIDLHAGMDLRRLKRRFGERITLYGNLDCGNVLSFATPEQVRQHVVDCLEAGQGSGGHVLCASNAVTASVPLANYLSVVNAYRDYFNLPRFSP